MRKPFLAICLLSLSVSTLAQPFSTWKNEYEANKEFFKDLEILSGTANQISDARKELIKNHGFEKSRKQIEFYDEYERQFRDIYGATIVLTSTLWISLDQRGLEKSTLMFLTDQVCSYMPTIYVNSFRKPTDKGLEIEQTAVLGWGRETKADLKITTKILEGIKVAHKAKNYFFHTCERTRKEDNWRR